MFRSTRARSETARSPAPGFPQPAAGFAGRRAELDRILAHFDRDSLFFIYGVGGIGKSEFVYQLMREITARPRWADAIAVLVDVRPGMTAPRILAQLLAAVGAAPSPRRGQPTEQAHLSEQLALLARLLDERPYLLFIDDVHNLAAESVAEALGYLSRRVQRSRLVVASRREIPLPPEAPTPVVTTLGPLDPDAAVAMMVALADRLQLPRVEPDAVMTLTHGSPFHIHRLLVRNAPDTGSLAETIAELAGEARRVLRAASIAEHWPSIDMLRRIWAGDQPLEAVLRDLEQRFLLELKLGQVVVHDLIREALLGQTSAAELVAAHDDAARLCLGELDAGHRAPLLLAVDATNHYLAAGSPELAWALLERWYRPLAAAGSAHLLRDPLERLRDALPARHVAIDLLIARGLVRASLLEEASRVLARVGDDRSAAEQTRYCVLAGEVAQHAGELARAAELFERAVACAPDPDARFGAQLRTASVAILADEGDRARAMIEAALAALPSPSARQRARAGWTRTVSWLFDERHERAVEEARRARDALVGSGLDDLSNQLAMLETIACVECDVMDEARAAAARIDEAGLRRRVAALYRAIVRSASGEAREASVELLAAHAYMTSHGDSINAYLAGHYGAAALAEIGELGKAQALAAQISRLARRAGLRAPEARSLTQEALFAAEAVQSGVAHRLASQAIASGHIQARSLARAHCAHARAYTVDGDITRALEHLAHARAAVAEPELALAHAAIDIDHAPIELVGGNLERAVELAERGIEHYRGRSRDHEAARARLVLAAAYVARGRRTDLLFAERTIAQAKELAEPGGLRSIQVGCAILSAALARRDHRDATARDLLVDALRELDPERGSLYASTLLAAIDGGVAARVAPGAVALLGHLGFSETVDCYLVDQHGRRAATAQDVARERALRDLFVDEVREVIVARHGVVEVRGRPMLCGLLSVVIQARGQPVAPDTLYKQVWGVAAYHPLQHRNTLYVAINRLRSCLREVLPDREVIERASNGWRLADDVDACVALAVRRPSA